MYYLDLAPNVLRRRKHGSAKWYHGVNSKLHGQLYLHYQCLHPSIPDGSPTNSTTLVSRAPESLNHRLIMAFSMCYYVYLVPDLYLSVESKLQGQLHFQLQCLLSRTVDGPSQRTLLRWSVEILILLGISILDPPSLLLFLFTEICSHHRTIQLFDHAYSTTTFRSRFSLASLLLLLLLLYHYQDVHQRHLRLLPHPSAVFTDDTDAFFTRGSSTKPPRGPPLGGRHLARNCR